jgi:hypothetical protein
MENSAECRVPANPGSVAATTWTGAPARASTIGSKKTAVHMPPGSGSTVDSASDGPDLRMSQSWPERRRVVRLGDRTTATYGRLSVATWGVRLIFRARAAPAAGATSVPDDHAVSSSDRSGSEPASGTQRASRRDPGRDLLRHRLGHRCRHAGQAELITTTRPGSKHHRSIGSVGETGESADLRAKQPCRRRCSRHGCCLRTAPATPRAAYGRVPMRRGSSRRSPQAGPASRCVGPPPCLGRPPRRPRSLHLLGGHYHAQD